MIGAAEIVIIGFLLFAAAMGDCSPDANGVGCEHDRLIKSAMFPGSLIAAAIFNVFYIRWLMRDKN